ncbi:hypothetical protein [Sphingomonas yabuuchiae]|uniref:hypothetical protein n=1 Tax=Sphingomonas yabuuchiae TaxID=172044 RepID=UPI003D9604E9
MAKQIPSALMAAATAIAAGETSDEVLRNIRVVDAATGEEIIRVISADAVAGTVTRFLVEDGNLVRKDGAFETVTEERAIRIEWIVPPEAPADVEPSGASDPATQGGDKA